MQFLIFLSLDQPIFAKQLNTLSILLHIDTATENAIVGLTKEGHTLGFQQNKTSNTHAAFVQEAIANLCSELNVALPSLSAIVVTMGPGSYTGLRVGLATAKGMAYALNKPIIGLSTLTLLSHHALQDTAIQSRPKNAQIFAAIDARRMEVFGALYNKEGIPSSEEAAIVIDESFLKSQLANGPLFCIGSGAKKIVDNFPLEGLQFIDSHYTIEDMASLAHAKLVNKDFEDIAYSSPNYIKDFYSIKPI